MRTHQVATPHTERFILFKCEAVDGDTIDAWVELGFSVCVQQRFRLKGFFAPELDGATPENGLAAKIQLQAALEGKTITVPRRGMRKDKFGRWLVTIEIDGVAADPFIALFPYQMSEHAHALDLSFARNAKRLKGGAL